MVWISLVLRVQHVSPVAGNVRCPAVDVDPQVVLGDQINREMIFKDFDIRMALDFAEQCPFNFSTGLVLVMKDAEFGMAAFLMQIEPAGFFLVKFNTPFHQFLDSFSRFGYGNPDNFRVAQVITGIDRIKDMLGISVGGVHHSGNASLGILGRCFISTGFGNDTDFSMVRNLQRITQTGNAGTNYQEIDCFAHLSSVLCSIVTAVFQCSNNRTIHNVLTN